MRAVVLTLGVLGVSAFLVDWNSLVWFGPERRTDDAILAGNPTRLAAHTAGPLRSVPVGDFQAVHAGDLLFEIDDRTQRARLARAQADVAEASATVDLATAQVALQQAALGVARANIASAAASLDLAQRERARQEALRGTEAALPRDLETAQAGEARARAALSGAEGGLRADAALVDVQRANLDGARAALAGRRAALDLAQIDLGYTRITAPMDGVVTARLVRPGQHVSNGTMLVTIVPLGDVWAVANYREVDVANMRIGQRATIKVDAQPGAVLHGRVDSVGPLSEARQSVLPPDRASGNFTKIVQRIPVKVTLDPGHPFEGALQPGLSVEVAIDTASSTR